MGAGGEPSIVFISYAHEDRDLLDRLLVVLKPLGGSGRVELWADPDIGVGRRWSDDIEENLARAEVAILLISADFMASDYIMGMELPRLAELDIPLVCVPIGPCAWQDVEPIASIQWPLDPHRPLRAMARSERDGALVRVYEAVKNLAPVLSVADEDPGMLARRPRPASALSSGRLGSLLGVPAYPAGYQPRPADLAALKERIRSTADVGLVGRRRTSGLHGQGGVGKSVLAAVLCHDTEVRSWFPDGVVWITLGESADLVNVQRELADHLGVELESTTARECLEELREAIDGRRCLVVIDDVWSIAAAEAFAVTSKQGRVLYTTRYPFVLAAISASAQAVDVLDSNSAFAFLEQAVGTVPEVQREAVERLVIQTGGVIMALSVVAAMARAHRGWADLADEMENLASVFRGHPYADVFKAMRLAVDGLGHKDAERYRLLGVFPEDLAIPEITVARLWGVEDAAPVLARLDGASLLDWRGHRIRLHDLQRAFVIFDGDGPWALAHRQVLDAHRPTMGWAYLPDEEPYLWDHLIYHLHMAGEHHQMAVVAANGRWMARRLYLSGPHAAALDVRRAQAAQPSDALSGMANALGMWGLFNTGLSQAGVAATLVARLPVAERDVEDLLGSVWLQPALGTVPAPTWRSTTGHTLEVRAAAFAPGGATLATVADDRTLRLWDVTTGAQRRVFTGDTPGVSAVAFAPDGITLASAGLDGKVRLWSDADSAERRVRTGHTGPISALAFASDGTLASASQDGTVRLWDFTTGSEPRLLTGHTLGARGVAFSADGRILASAGGDGTLRIWDADAGTERRSVPTGHTGRIKSLAVAPDGALLASASDDGTVRIWNFPSMSEQLVLYGHTCGVRRVAFSPDGGTLASTGGDQTLRLWDVSAGSEVAALRLGGPLRFVAWSRDGNVLVVNHGSTVVWLCLRRRG